MEYNDFLYADLMLKNQIEQEFVKIFSSL